MNTGNSALVYYTKVYSLLQFVSSHWKKEREYESWVHYVSWTKRNNMSWVKRKNRHRPWIFFLYFLVVLTCLFIGLIFTCVHLVCEAPFQNSPQNGVRNFYLTLYHPGWCSTDCLYLITSSSQLPQTEWLPSFRLVLAGGTNAQKIWDLCFFSHHHQLTQSFTCDQLTHNQCFSLGHSEVSHQLQ